MNRWLIAGSALFGLTACENPDTEAELDEFRAVADLGSGDTVGPVGCGEATPNPDGDYFCALSATLAREKPLYMYLTFTLDGTQLTVESQPLVRDFEEDDETPMANPRTPVGDQLPVYVGELAEDGSFFVDWPGIEVAGEANPVTYRLLGGDLTLDGAFINDDVAYGQFGGAVTNPAPISLTGSTFACVRTEDPTTLDPVYYNEEVTVLTDCELPGEGSGAGDGSGASEE
jgi:hypothetical protein